MSHERQTLTSRWEIDDDRIRLADTLLVHLERTLAVAQPVPAGVVPRAYGLAKPVPCAGAAIVDVPAGEALWLGFQAVDPQCPAVVRVRVERPQPIDALTGEPWDEQADTPRNNLVCPPGFALAGIKQKEGYVPFGQRHAHADILEEITVMAGGAAPAAVTVRLLTPSGFARLTGQEPQQPIDPEHAYKGWRLP